MAEPRLRPPLIFMYHAVQPMRNHTICVSPDRLRRQMDWLVDHAFRGVSVNDLLRSEEHVDRRRLVGLTFDDGFRDFLDAAIPILQERNFTATVYVVSGKFGGTNAWDKVPRLPLLSATDVIAIRDSGFEIGSHSLTHAHLTHLDPVDVDHEIRFSRQTLAAVTGSMPEGFCYPYGEYNSAAITAVKKAGYSYACAVKSYGSASRFTLPRVYVGEHDTAWRLEAARLVHAASAFLGRDLR